MKLTSIKEFMNEHYIVELKEAREGVKTQVTKDKFFDKIGPMDVLVSSTGKPNYISLFKSKNGNLIGSIEDKTYYLYI